jgi:hypothetical protein
MSVWFNRYDYSITRIKPDKLLDQHNLGGFDSNPQIGAITDQFAHLLIDRRNQEKIFRRLFVALVSSRNFPICLRIQANDVSDIFIQFEHLETLVYFSASGTGFRINSAFPDG